MDDDFDLGDFGQQAQQQVPTDWTQSDNLRLMRMNAGLSTVQQQVDEGVLSPEDGAQLYGQVQAMRQPLMARQAAAVQSQQQQGKQQLQETAAMQAGMDHSERVWRAKGFNDLVAEYTDPLTGQTVHMVEDRKGKWEPIDFGRASNAPPEGSQGSVDYFPLAGAEGFEANNRQAFPGTEVPGVSKGSDVALGSQMDKPYFGEGSPGAAKGGTYLPNVVPGNLDYGGTVSEATPQQVQGQSIVTHHAPGPDQGPPAAADSPPGSTASPPEEAATSAQPSQPPATQVQPAADGGHVMTIINGQNQERWHFAPDGKTTLIDAQGPRYQQQAQADVPGMLVNGGEMATLHARAAQSLAPYRPNPGNYPNTAQGRLGYAHDLAQHEARVEQTARGWVNNLHQERLRERTQGEISQRQDTAAKAKADLEAKREAAAQDKQDAKQFASELDAEVKHRTGQWERRNQEPNPNDSTKTIPQDMPHEVRDQIEQDAETTVRNRPQWRGHAKWGPQGAQPVPNFDLLGVIPPGGRQPDPKAQQRADLEKTLGNIAGGSFGR